MNKYLLDQYFASEEYNEFERNEVYLKLTDHMNRCLSDDDFLDMEEELHNLLIYMVEHAFAAGGKAVQRNIGNYLGDYFCRQKCI